MSPARLLAVDLAATSRNWALPPDGQQAIRRSTPAGWRVTFVDAPTISDGDGNPSPSPQAVDAIRDAEIYFGFGISRPLFLEARALKWVHSAAAGVAGALFAEMQASDVVLTNSAGVHAIPIAEQVVGGVLMLLRSLDVAIDQQRAGVWNKEAWTGADVRVRELGECRVLVLGTGGIGQAVAQRLTALGARCVGIRRRPKLGAPVGFERVAGLERWETELPKADIVVLAAPATPETHAALDARRLALLPSEAIVVNVARGALLDEKALVQRIRAKALRGAVLDVFATEPLASTSPLWQLREVVLTPHVAAVSPRRFWERELSLFFENWERYVRGEPMLNVVDKQAGY